MSLQNIIYQHTENEIFSTISSYCWFFFFSFILSFNTKIKNTKNPSAIIRGKRVVESPMDDVVAVWSFGLKGNWKTSKRDWPCKPSSNKVRKPLLFLSQSSPLSYQLVLSSGSLYALYSTSRSSHSLSITIFLSLTHLCTQYTQYLQPKVIFKASNHHTNAPLKKLDSNNWAAKNKNVHTSTCTQISTNLKHPLNFFFPLLFFFLFSLYKGRDKSHHKNKYMNI